MNFSTLKVPFLDIYRAPTAKDIRYRASKAIIVMKEDGYANINVTISNKGKYALNCMSIKDWERPYMGESGFLLYKHKDINMNVNDIITEICKRLELFWRQFENIKLKEGRYVLKMKNKEYDWNRIVAKYGCLKPRQRIVKHEHDKSPGKMKNQMYEETGIHENNIQYTKTYFYVDRISRFVKNS